MLALGIILLVLCLLFLLFLVYRQEFKDWRKEQKARRHSMETLFKGEKHGK